MTISFGEKYGFFTKKKNIYLYLKKNNMCFNLSFDGSNCKLALSMCVCTCMASKGAKTMVSPGKKG